MKKVRLIVALVVLTQHLNAQSIINAYAKVTSISGTTLNLSNVNVTHDDFLVGERIIIMQMQDDIIGSNTNNDANFGEISNIASVGLFEEAIIATVTGGGVPTSIEVQDALNNTYNTGSNSSVQIISFRTYTNLTTSSDLTALAWDGDVGGVFAINVTGTLTLANDIDVSEQGFRGGAPNDTEGHGSCNGIIYISTSTEYAHKGESIYKSTVANYDIAQGKIANGGGGGCLHNGGGAGGGNFTAGGDGGAGWNGTLTGCDPSGGGIGGVDLSDYISANKVFMGGGGGGGQHNATPAPVGSTGGSGGGIVLIKASSVATTAGCGGVSIAANGAGVVDSGPDGGGGAGAGGTILFEVDTWSLNCQLDVSAAGGNGADVGHPNVHGGGGGGGKGVIILSGAAPSSNFSVDNSEGSGGVNGTGAGSTSALSGGSSPGSPTADSDGVLESESGILPVSLLYWRGTQREAGALLSWSTATEIDNDYFTIERSVDGVSWKTIATVAGHGTTTEVKEYEYFDRNHFLPATYYRLSQTDYDGTTEVFEILMVTGRESLTPVILYPNPSSGKFAVQLPVGDHTIEVLDMIGKRINIDVKREGSLASFDLSGRPSGIYILRVIDPKGANNYRIRLK